MSGALRSRLGSSRPALAEAIRRADGGAQRDVTVRAVDAAIASARLDDPLIADALRFLRAGAAGPFAGHRDLVELAADLDDVALDMGDDSETGAEQYPPGYLEAFGRARAAQAVVDAMDDDPCTAALEAVYEALASVDEDESDLLAARLLDDLLAPAPRATRWYERRWEETRGDDLDAWGPATYYLETDQHGVPVRQVERYDAGPTLRYGPGHEQDTFGQLASVAVDRDEDWSRWVITHDEFEVVWQQADEGGPPSTSVTSEDVSPDSIR